MKYAYSETESVAGASDVVVNSVARDLSRSNINLVGSNKVPLRYPVGKKGNNSSSNSSSNKAIRTTDYGFIDMPGGGSNHAAASEAMRSSRSDLLSSESTQPGTGYYRTRPLNN